MSVGQTRSWKSFGPKNYRYYISSNERIYVIINRKIEAKKSSQDQISQFINSQTVWKQRLVRSW